MNSNFTTTTVWSSMYRLSVLMLSLGVFQACSQTAPHMPQNEISQPNLIPLKTNTTPEAHTQLDSLHLNLPDHLKTVVTAKYKLVGPKKVKRWEPSGVAATDTHLWIVSDRDGWLTRYSLPLSQGINQPDIAYQVRPKIDNRLKWEGLEWSRGPDGKHDTLLMLEAISRSVWQCKDPQKGCPDLTKLNLDPLNEMLDQSVPQPFKYIMFEAIALFNGPFIGVRGYQHQTKGLIPWSLMANFKGEMLLDVRNPLHVDGRDYGLSGATYDKENRGFWLTWSHEAENISTRESVSGLLTFSPIQVAKKELKDSDSSAPSLLEYGAHRIDHHNPSQFKICAHFQLKPEGVSINTNDKLFVVFDEDLDRKSNEEDHKGQYFSLLNNQDYAYVASIKDLMKSCR